MLISEARTHFGSMSGIARALHVSRTTVWKWKKDKGGRIPASYAAQLHVMTSGKLSFDVEKYGAQP